MLFNTIPYFVFLIIVVTGYYLLPSKTVKYWLLAASYYFYMQWNKYYLALIVGVTLLTYVGALLIEKYKNEDERNIKRIVVTVGSLLCLFLLGYFKYSDFIMSYVNIFLRLLTQKSVDWVNRFVLPVGISFYTLQSLGYLIDVYRDDIKAEKNIISYALFISFFPQLVAGPIERSKNLLSQIKCRHKFDYDNFRRGGLYILYGLFLKMVLADRLAIIVDAVYNDYETNHGVAIVIATIFFAFQIYCDFYGYSIIARGSALLMGITLMENFNAPYYSASVKEFWRRWHISLSTWFKDYLYIPLGGNRRGKIRKDINLVIVFGLSGLWHGASVAYILWGILNAVYQVIGDCFVKITVAIPKALRKLFTFILITFSWLFFRAGNLQDAVQLLKNLVLLDNFHILYDGQLFAFGVEKGMFCVMIASMLLLLLVDYTKYKGIDVAELVLSKKLPIRTICYVGLAIAIIVFGCYGEIYDTQQFIYFQF